MKKIRTILFSINEYDSDGDVIEEGIFLHFGDTRVKVANTIDEFEQVAKQIDKVVDEVRTLITTTQRCSCGAWHGAEQNALYQK